MEDSPREKRDKSLRRIDALLGEGQSQEQVVNSPTYAVLKEYGYPRKPCFLCMYSNPSDDGDCLQRHWMDQCNLLQFWTKQIAIDKQQVEQSQDAEEPVEEMEVVKAESLQEFEKWFAGAEFPSWYEQYYGRGVKDMHRKIVEEG